jgi:hypothetical protein
MSPSCNFLRIPSRTDEPRVSPGADVTGFAVVPPVTDVACPEERRVANELPARNFEEVSHMPFSPWLIQAERSSAITSCTWIEGTSIRTASPSVR